MGLFELWLHGTKQALASIRRTRQCSVKGKDFNNLVFSNLILAERWSFTLLTVLQLKPAGRRSN